MRVVFMSIFLLLSCFDSKDKITHESSGIVLNQENIYADKITPEEFLLALKTEQDLFQFAVIPDSIPKNWIKKTDVIALSLYLDDTTKCTEVINFYSSVSLSDEYKSTIQQESLKLINLYFTKKYPNSSAISLTQSEVREWIRTNN